MEKSIEKIWKEGFLKNDALIAPKINDLYNQKSIDIVDKFRRLYKINIIGITLFALILLPIATFVHIPYMGIPMFLILMSVANFGMKFKKKLDAINKNANSYQYLKSFNDWTKEMMAFNTKISRFLYPFVFLSMVAGFWFGSFGGNIPGNDFVNRLLIEFPDMIMIFGLPLFGVIGLLFILILLAVFGGKIGEWDLKIGYGRILKRLDALLADMEELRTA
ncbi:MAG: hypothetical protein HQ471_03980 [Flavobacteriales bacterium]|jgi:hypothetical protein|nr:hypothetical protein [Flavobacteriales bacterium]